MNFQGIASAYDSSGSESDEHSPSRLVSTLDSPDKSREKGDVQAVTNQERQARSGDAKNQPPESNHSKAHTSPPPPPPPPVALLGVTETPKKLHSRESQEPSQPLTKKRKIEDRPESSPARLLLPRQVQTKIPNVSTEDLQSYGITSAAAKEPDKSGS